MHLSVEKLPATPGALTGNGVGEAGAGVASITFATLGTGSTTLAFSNGVAFDSEGNTIEEIKFDRETATITQP